MRQLITRFRDVFFNEIDKKPSWGREQIKELFLITLSDVLLGKKEDE